MRSSIYLLQQKLALKQNVEHFYEGLSIDFFDYYLKLPYSLTQNKTH